MITEDRQSNRLLYTGCLVATLVWLGILYLPAAERVTLPESLLRSWDSDDGLPPAAVQSIARTPDGYVWVGTSGGLVRFDCTRFVLMGTNETHLEDEQVTRMMVTRAGELWVGTESGSVVRRSGDGFSTVNLPPRTRGTRINTICEDQQGSVWVGTAGAGVLRWREGRWEVFTRSNGLPVDAAARIMSDGTGKLWAMAGAKLVWFDQKRWQPCRAAASLDTQVMSAAPAAAGGVWVATAASSDRRMGGRVFRVQEDSVLESGSYPWSQDTLHTIIRALHEDATGRLWVGTMGAGVFFRDPGGPWEALGSGTSFSQTLVNCFSDDTEGAVWIGLDGAQIDRVRRRPVRTLHLPSEWSQSVIRMVCARRDGSIWVGTDGAGVFRHYEGNWQHYGAEAGLSNGYIGSIYEDRNTNLWVGTWDGLFQLRGEQFGPKLKAKEGPLIIRAIQEDHSDNLWLGVSGGAIRMRDGQIEEVPGTAEYGGATVMVLAEDASSQIWAGLEARGLFRLEGGHFVRAPTEAWNGRGEISAILPDNDGGLWIGSLARGLAYLKNGQLRLWTRNDGLPSNGIRALAEDSAGNLWCSSDNGVFGCPKKKLLDYEPRRSSPLLCWEITVADGLDTRRCSGTGYPVVARGQDGRFWVPNWHALAVFDPAQLSRKESFPTPMVEEVVVDGDMVSRPPHGKLEVKSTAQRFEIHFTSPVFEKPERVRFRYRLEGAESAWVEAGQRRVAYYNHLPPGGYAFKLMAGGSDGEWHEAPTVLHLEVVPRLWERALVQRLGGLALLGGVAVLVWSIGRARLRRRLAEVERQGALERERARIARDMHDKIGARLTQISILTAMADGSAEDANEVRTHTRKLTDVSRDLTRSLDEIVWAVRPQNDNLESLVDYLAEALRDLCDGSPVRFWFSGPAQVPKLEVPATVRHNILLACFEAVNNTLKHSGASELRVSARLEERSLRIELADNGCGFDVAEGEAKRSGLLHLRQRLDEIGGACELFSTRGHGTRLIFSVPLIAGLAGQAAPLAGANSRSTPPATAEPAKI